VTQPVDAVTPTDGVLLDIPGAGIEVARMPEPPPGMRISHIDVVVRLVPDEGASKA